MKTSVVQVEEQESGVGVAEQSLEGGEVMMPPTGLVVFYPR